MITMQDRMRQRLVALAPVASITNSIYRRICKRFGADFAVTELVSSEGLTRDSLRSYKLARFEESERPIAVQIFGGDPEKMGRAAELVNEMRPDAVDINMGCPARKVVAHCGGSSLMRDTTLLAQVVRAVVQASEAPVSVKIRAGWDDSCINAVDVARVIEAEGGQWVTVHPRTRKQGFGGQARWDIIRDVKRAVSIPVVGNGDIVKPEDAQAMFEHTGCDSVMVGRGSFGYPWIFEQIKALLAGRSYSVPTARQRIEMALENLRMEIEESPGDPYHAVVRMRKHLAWYIAGLSGAKELRREVFQASSVEQTRDILEKFAHLEPHATEARLPRSSIAPTTPGRHVHA
jgi:tRNA-dihydrouridine synthase B